MNLSLTIMVVAFVAASSAVLLVFTLVGGNRVRLDERLDDLTGRDSPLGDPLAVAPSSVAQLAMTTLPRVGSALVPSDDKERTLLKTRLIHAGLYSKQAMVVFLGVKLLLMVFPALLGMAAGLVGLVPIKPAVLVGGCLGILGMIGPSFWLDYKKSKRQATFRRALPDALDVMVICLEGGLSLPGALRRVAAELQGAHPSLALELNIVVREIQLGRNAGDSLHQMGLRTDLEEVRTLASVISQAEKFGASLVKSLRVHADTLRLKRQQRAEEMAQKAAIKILFPTLLFIFPAIFVVILGPAAFQIYEVMGNLGR
jgi:tight adherence protein C